MARRAGKWLLTLSLAAMLPPVIEHGALPGFGGLLGLNRTAEASYQTTTAPSRIVTALTTGLQAAEPAARATAACELGLRGSDAISAVPALVTLLADDARVDDLECGDNRGNGDRWMSGGEPRHCSTSPARESAQALSRIGTDAIKPLIAALSDMRATMRRYAAIALGMVDDRSVLKPAVAHLVTTLHDSDWQVRRSAVWALGEVRDAQLVTPIAASLKDEHPRVREMAAHGLGELEDPRALPALVGALDDTEWTVRREATHGLGELHATTAIDVIARHLDDEHPQVRQMSAWALGEIKDRRAATGLRHALNDSRIRGAAPDRVGARRTR